MITFKSINSQSPDKNIVEAIYNEAFPERERMVPFEGMLSVGQKIESSKIYLAYDGEKAVGFLNFFDFEDFIFLCFFAVNSELRGGGYGSKIIHAFEEELDGKSILGCFETPLPGTSNLEQREKRKVFYERLGMPGTDYSFGEDPEDRFTLFSSCQDERNLDYIREFLDFAIELGKASGSADKLLNSKFYKTVNGEFEERTFENWLQ